jgi:hypothetical protein
VVHLGHLVVRVLKEEQDLKVLQVHQVLLGHLDLLDQLDPQEYLAVGEHPVKQEQLVSLVLLGQQDLRARQGSRATKAHPVPLGLKAHKDQRASKDLLEPLDSLVV